MLENFFVYHRNGQCLLSASYSGRKLTTDYIAGLRVASATLFSFISNWSPDDDGRGGRPGPSAPAALAAPGGGGSASTATIGAGAGGSGTAPGWNQNRSETQISGPIPSIQEVPSMVAKEIVLGDGIIELSINDMSFQFLDLGVYMLIAQSLRSCPKSCLTRTILEVRDTMRFHLGTFDNISQDPTLFESISDIVRHVLDRRSDLSALSSGVPFIPLSSRTQTILDRLLSGLEDNHNVYGSAILIGRSVLHKRLPIWNTKMMLQLVSARPMNTCTIRSIPVFIDGKAQTMFLLRLTPSLILGFFVHITASYHELLPYLDHLEVSLEDDMFQLPREEPIIPLRTYSGLDTLAFVYSNSMTGQVLVPEPRYDEGRKDMNQRIIDTFHWFYETVMLMKTGRPINQITLTNSDYIFHHIQRNDQTELSVLYSVLIDGNVMTLSEEIFDNIRRSALA